MRQGELPTNEAESWFNQAKEKFEAGDFEGAIASFDEAIELKHYLVIAIGTHAVVAVAEKVASELI